MEWERPSDRVRELLRRGAQILLSAPEEWFDEILQAVLQAPRVGAVADDPVLRDGVRRTNRVNILYWAASNAHDPGSPVAANLGEEPMGIARDLVRRGLGESLIDGYRAGQQAPPISATSRHSTTGICTTTAFLTISPAPRTRTCWPASRKSDGRRSTHENAEYRVLLPLAPPPRGQAARCCTAPVQPDVQSSSFNATTRCSISAAGP